jgi:gas vesicle protein
VLTGGPGTATALPLEVMMEHQRFGLGNFAIGFVAGAVAGAVAAYLTAPRSGRESREALRRSAEDLRRRASDAVSNTQERITRASRAAREAFAGDNGSPIREP